MSKKSIVHTKISNRNEVEALFNKINKDSEFEFIFFSKKERQLTLEKYVILAKFFSKRTSLDKKLELITGDNTLDISYSPDTEKSYRCTLSNKEVIEKYMKKLSMANNHVIFRNLVIASKTDKNIVLMKKEKSKENTIDIDDFCMRVRLSNEVDFTKEDIEELSKLDETQMGKINFRFKERTSLYVLKNDKEYVRIDLTQTRTERKYGWLNKVPHHYELEIEASMPKPNSELLEKMYLETDILFKVLQQSNFIISTSETQKVIEQYRKILSVPKQYEHSLYGRQPISLELQYMETLANKFAVTDKAEGERHFLVIINNNVYLMNKNLDVKDTGIILKGTKTKYNNSILDGELMFVKNRHIFLAFDCLFNGEFDLRKESKLEVRLKNADDIIENCFVFDKQTGYKQNNIIQKDFQLNKILDHHKKEIKNSFDALNHDIAIEKQYVLVRRKYFIHALGAKPWEIDNYAVLIWNLYTNDQTIKCPYILDGLIFQPNEQAYVANAKESRFYDFKWKPPEKNSIDFYIEFVKDTDGNIVTVYDNSYDDISDDPNAVDTGTERLRNKTYKICKLHVGQIVGKIQSPVLFREYEDLNEAYVMLQDNEARDMDGNILSDKTVVEFYYNKNSTLSSKFRWIPMRTRFDKTEAVIKYKQNYGNFITVADKVWQSITNPILMSDFDDLARGNNPEKNMYAYDKKLEALRKRISHEQIVSAAKENSYFQKITELATPMRNYHNFIKSNIIYTYCHSMYQDNKQKSVLDLGCGRGGDMGKYYYAKTAFYVGVDYDKEALFNIGDSATSRYDREKRKPGFTKMFFIHGDQSSELDYESQYQSLGGMDTQNKKLIEEYFSKDPAKRKIFDVISCQFAMHYSLKNPETWNNYKKNISNYLRNDGYVLITTFDGNAVRTLLKNKDNYLQEYTDENGDVKVLFDIQKKYEDDDNDNNTSIMGTGNAIDVHMSWLFDEGSYQTEYLVDERFLIDELRKDCNLELVTMDTFGNQFNLFKEYLTNYARYEADERTRDGLLRNCGNFYTKNSINDGCKIYTDLEKFYVFRKVPTVPKSKGGKMMDPDKFVVPELIGYNNEYSCLNSVHHILRNQKIIPKTLSMEDFCRDMNIRVDNDLDVGGNLKKIAKNIIIYHETEDKKTEKIIDGFNILIAERDCNDEYSVSIIPKSKKIMNNDNAIILMKEGSLFAPVFSVDKDKIKNGIFHMNDAVIKELLKIDDE